MHTVRFLLVLSFFTSFATHLRSDEVATSPESVFIPSDRPIQALPVLAGVAMITIGRS
jgi:hypothetical protein